MPAVRVPRESLTARGERTRQRLLAAAEEIFGERGFQFASIADITRGAGVAQGTFYLYFDTKRDLIRAIVDERGHELRAVLAKATEGDSHQLEKERAGFVAFFGWMARHRALYRIVRQVEYIDAELYQGWYRQIADGYAVALGRSAAAGEIADLGDAETLAYALMGIGDFVGMRWLMFEQLRVVPDRAVAAAVCLVERALSNSPVGGRGEARGRG